MLDFKNEKINNNYKFSPTFLAFLKLHSDLISNPLNLEFNFQDVFDNISFAGFCVETFDQFFNTILLKLLHLYYHESDFGPKIFQIGQLNTSLVQFISNLDNL